MGVLFDVYNNKKKYCEMCGCIMLPINPDTICDCCLDELLESDPGEEVED